MNGLVDASRDAGYSGRERHSSSRFNSLGYPQRALRTANFLYIQNLRPERWPAGTPQKFGDAPYPKDDVILSEKLGPPHGGYHDIDACPTLTYLIAHADDPKLGRYLDLSVARRPAEELYDIRRDPACLHNLATDPQHTATHRQLRDRLTAFLKETGDPRVVAADRGDIFETYPRYSALRWFPTPDWVQSHPERVPKQPWLEARRPRASNAQR